MIEDQDMFEAIDQLPVEVQNAIAVFDTAEASYSECNELLAVLEPLGYTFKLGLDGTPYDLQRIDTEG